MRLEARQEAHSKARPVVLVIDETVLRLFPPLHASWSKRGSQSHVGVIGQNARRVIFGAINIRTGHRIIRIASSQKQHEFQEFLRDLRCRYRERPLCLLLDAHGSHTAPATVAVAKDLGIRLLWLPKQSPELNAMDHLWRHLKRRIATNRQYGSIDEEAEAARAWVMSLPATTALRLVGITSKNYWLRRFSQNFLGHT
ncbi:MAG TPA: IS630 family transposase [Candidatus Paceibacterota bacterium]|nr:IS630 family transposase [Candidatus Paceibacterota bacterium]